VLGVQLDEPGSSSQEPDLHSFSASATIPAIKLTRALKMKKNL